MRRLVPAGAILAALLVPRASAAAEDGGTQSPFAAGAGNRALAMGGAFVAGVDDASALIWNPAGLARLQRSELQAMQSGDLGEGFSESYAAFALPSWRWGTVGLAFRHFGVGGIEQRDDRNVLTGEDLSESDSEFTLGYARGFGEAWQVGAAFKLQQQSLAGFRGSGIGLDLGMHVRPGPATGIRSPWLDRVTWGLALRNVVEPAIRLDRESVPDPVSFSTGFAYQLPLRFTDVAVAEIDLVKARGVGARMRVGIEYRLHSLAAIRFGMNGSRMTAGTGVSWHDVTLDYAFEDGPLSEGHRFGVSVPFGRTVEDSRMAALREEDEALQRRLAEAFIQRQAERVQQLVGDAAQRLAAGDFAGALEVLAVAATLAPEDRRIPAMQADAFRGRAIALERAGEHAAAALVFEQALGVAPGDSLAAAGVARCRAESHRVASRTEAIRGLFAVAMDAFAREDLPAARDAFVAVLQKQPGDAEAGRMLERTREAIAQRVGALTAQALRFIEHGLPAEAEPLIRQAAALDPNAPQLGRTQAALERAREAARAAARPPARSEAPAAPEPARPELTDREADDLYGRGVDALRAGRSAEAVRYLEIVWAARPSFRQTGELLKKEYLTLGMEAFASGQLEAAVLQWRQVLKIDPNDERARGYLSRAQKQMDRSREILGGQ